MCIACLERIAGCGDVLKLLLLGMSWKPEAAIVGATEVGRLVKGVTEGMLLRDISEGTVRGRY